MAEEISHRYRRVLLTHVPGIESVPTSFIKSVYDNSETIDKATTIGHHAFNIYRLFRLITPQGWVSECAARFRPPSSGISDSLQFKLKKALLQDIAAVAIDLYSGRFQHSEEELAAVRVDNDDQQHRATALDPLRVCVIGQVSAGKSSVVNALLREARAEIDALPATDNKLFYDCSLEGMELLHLIDLPGLDGSARTEESILDEVKTANVVLWVLKANQPARALDTAFKNRLDDFYHQPENRSRKRPVIIGLLNQVDKLKPVAEWNPPYDLSIDDSAKANIIRDAMQHNQQLLNPDRLIPLSLSVDRPQYNIVELESAIDHYFQEGIQVQLNQRRLAAGDNFSLGKQLGRVYQSGRSLFQLIKEK